VTNSDSVSAFEPSGINQPFAIEGDDPEHNLTFAVQEDPLDQHMVPDSESGAYEAVESEST
jgi:hypothetical protein